MNRILAALLLLSVAGCGSSTASVSGRVTLDGQPLDTGNVAFLPVEAGPVANGTIDASGNYTLQIGSGSTGLAPGEYIVVVVATRPGEQNPNSLDAPLPVPITPPRYSNKDTTPFKFTLVPGSNTINLELTSP